MPNKGQYVCVENWVVSNHKGQYDACLREVRISVSDWCLRYEEKAASAQSLFTGSTLSSTEAQTSILQHYNKRIKTDEQLILFYPYSRTMFFLYSTLDVGKQFHALVIL